MTIAFPVGAAPTAVRVSRPPRIELLFVAYAVSVPFGSAIEIPGLPEPLGNASSLLGAATGVAMLYDLVRTRRIDQGAVAPALWLLFLGGVTLTWFWSINTSTTLDDIIVLTSLVGVNVVVAYRVHSHVLRQFLVGALAASGAITGAVAVAQWVTDTLPTDGPGPARFALVGDDANITAGALMYPIACGLIGVLEWYRLRHRVLATGAVALAVIGVVLTQSRGGLLGLVAVVAVVAIRRWSLGRVLLLGGFIAALLAVVPLPALERGTGSTGRTQIWSVALRACSDHCWFGSGAGTFPEVHQQVALRFPELAPQQLRFQAHNIFVGSLVEGGVLLTVLLAVIIAHALLSAHRNHTPFGEATFAAVVGVVVVNQLVSNVEFKYFWLALLGAALCVAPVVAAPRPNRRNRR